MHTDSQVQLGDLLNSFPVLQLLHLPICPGLGLTSLDPCTRLKYLLPVHEPAVPMMERCD